MSIREQEENLQEEELLEEPLKEDEDVISKVIISPSNFTINII